MTEQIKIRLPWVTLTGTPDRIGRLARLRCLAAMAVHEVVELVAGSTVAHSMRAANRYAIGAPTITVPPSRRNTLYLITSDQSFPDVYGPLINGRVVELRVYESGTTNDTYESIFAPGRLKEVRISNPTTSQWDPIAEKVTTIDALFYGPTTLAGVSSTLSGVEGAFPSGSKMVLGHGSIFGSLKYGGIAMLKGISTSVVRPELEQDPDLPSGIYNWDGTELTFVRQLYSGEILGISTVANESFSEVYAGGIANSVEIPGIGFCVAFNTPDPDTIPILIDGFTSNNLTAALGELKTDLSALETDLNTLSIVDDIILDDLTLVASHQAMQDVGIDGYMDGDTGFIKDTSNRLWSAAFMASEQSAFVPLQQNSATEWDYASGVVVPIDNLPVGFQGSGGPIIDFGNGTGMMILHLEGDSYQKLAAAKVVMDASGPVSITYLGDIITPHISQAESQALGNGFVAFAGSGAHIHKDGYVYLYHNEWTTEGELFYSVASCLSSDIVTAVNNDSAPLFLKWNGTGWTENGIGGLGYDIGLNSPRGNGSFLKLRDGRWMCVMPMSPGEGTVWYIGYCFTTDGFNFTPWEYFAPSSTNEWYASMAYSGDPDHPDEMTGPRAWLLTTESDPNDRWGTNRIVRGQLRYWVAGSLSAADLNATNQLIFQQSNNATATGITCTLQFSANPYTGWRTDAGWCTLTVSDLTSNTVYNGGITWDDGVGSLLNSVTLTDAIDGHTYKAFAVGQPD